MNTTTQTTELNADQIIGIIETSTVPAVEPLPFPISSQRTAEDEANKQMMLQLAASLFAILKPQLKAFIEETVTIELSSQVNDAVETMLEQPVFERAVMSLIEDNVPTVDKIIQDGDFDFAVRDVVSEMEFSVTVEGNGRRY